jgi:hypothetical protein
LCVVRGLQFFLAISTKEWKAQLLKNVNISSITDQTTIALEHEVVHGETCCVCISFFFQSLTCINGSLYIKKKKRCCLLHWSHMLERNCQ